MSAQPPPAAGAAALSADAMMSSEPHHHQPQKTAAPLPGQQVYPSPSAPVYPGHVEAGGNPYTDAWDVEAQLADPKAPMVSGMESEVHRYLAQVYMCLAGLVGAATVGCGVQRYAGIHPLISIFFALGFLMYVYCTRDQGNTPRRIAAFVGFGFCDGVAIGPLIGMAARIDPTLILSAVGLTAMIFTCFTLAARYAKRRSFLYLGGLLGSCILGLIACSLLSLFFRWKILHTMQLYGGLVVFSLYIVYDTQKMIEKAHMGVRDHLIDALELFIDLMAIFRRILIILMRSRSDD